MFVQEVKQYKEIFQGIKWRLRFTGEAAWKGMDVRMEELEVIEGQSITQAYQNETGVIGPAVFLDIYGDAYLSSGYGKQPCFPHIFPANLIFFSGPVLLSIAINFVCLLRVIGHICILSNEIGNISMSTPFTHAKVYLRILALSGFLWITGIMAAMLESDWLDYVFTLLCGLQGFFISLAGLTTRQVVRKFKYKKEPVIQTLSDSKIQGQQTHLTSRF